MRSADPEAACEEPVESHAGNRRRTPGFDALVALALFGCIPVVVKYTSANAWTIGIFRLLIATTVVALYGLWKRRIERPTLRELAILLLIGVLFFGHWLTYFLSIKSSTASIAAIGLSTYGVDLMILGVLSGHGRLRASELAAVAMAITGAIIVVPDFHFGSGAVKGMALALASAFFYATLPILHQRISRLNDTTRTLAQFGVALLLFSFFLRKASWHLAASDWYSLLFLAVGATLIAHSLWIRVTTRMTPALASVIYYGNVPFAVALSVALLHDPVTWRTIAGALLIVAATTTGVLQKRTTEGRG